MDVFAGYIPQETTEIFVSDIGSGEFFSYVHNLVSLEKCLSVMGILSPDFILRENHILWTANASTYEPAKRPLTSNIGSTTKERERYLNNFEIGQFFRNWESDPRPAETVDKVKDQIVGDELLRLFADNVAKFWSLRLNDLFPDRQFEFEIGNDLLGEFGLCLTFSQT